MNLRMATQQLAGLRVANRVRTIPNVRRRIPVTIVNESPEVVIVRQSVQNIGTAIKKVRPLQNQRV